MGHPGTDSQVQATVVTFARDIGMKPIELHKEQPGFVLNAARAVAQLRPRPARRRCGDPETVDRTWRICTGLPAGPSAILDVIGLTTPYNIGAAFPDERSQAVAKYLKENYIDQGKLGRSTGEGFFKYS